MGALIKNVILPVVIGVMLWFLLPALRPVHRFIWTVLSALTAVLLAHVVDRPKEDRTPLPATSQRIDLSGNAGIAGDITAGGKTEIVMRDKVLQQTIINAPSAMLSSIWESQDYHEHPTPKEIKEAIDAVAPYARPGVTKNYLGIKVRWPVIFHNIREQVRGHCVFMSCAAHTEQGPFLGVVVVCYVDLKKYPQLRVAREKQRLWVAGEISEIVHLGFYIELSNAHIKFEN